jgi:hypothetical protein
VPILVTAQATPLASSKAKAIAANTNRMRFIRVPFHEGRGDQP